MVDELKRFNVLVKFLARKSFEGTEDIKDDILAFEDAIFDTGLGEAYLNTANSGYDRIDIYEDAAYYAEYDDGTSAPYKVCYWRGSIEELEMLLKKCSTLLYNQYISLVN